ncbi:p060 [Rhizobium phage 16-3]|nr:p060 [Rhizobium phage 16-3]ABF71313.1 p060 [Rhizobium phage 16-3]
MAGDTYITVGARFALWVIITVGCVMLLAGTAYQAYALDRQMAVQARV